jgi:ubiquitin-like modifier-activating enzyme ATG7
MSTGEWIRTGNPLSQYHLEVQDVHLKAWGVHTITFVDNSKVSFSNPVRQSLFTFNDSVNSGDNYKSIKASSNLKLIYPGVNANGIVLSIPMPGHFVNEAIRKKTEEDVECLEKLISEHDCVFLLMDTRESRWLPTLICAAQGKVSGLGSSCSIFCFVFLWSVSRLLSS